ncbi:hypothetical protein OIU85_002274 [Salix viminalis]|uniref:RRM domain-containing protein n=1 Tax=Salix viminalis TaxID=40686 RepID=A0A9Q0VQL4_SALVM|nr:hypothetical protein OIU85_002274 [Salix viminalis]
MGSRIKIENPHTGDGASPGKIFIGGLAKDTTYATFNKHFGKYGEITDSVIEDTHVINGKQVEIKRTIPKGSGQSKDFKTKKIFVGGIPSSVTEDEFQNFFSKYGKVVEHQIIRDHETNRSRGFGFIIFDSEEVVDEMLSNGNMIDMAGTQVEIKKAEPKKASNPPSAPSYSSNTRGHLACLVDSVVHMAMVVVVGTLVVAMEILEGTSLGGYRAEASLGYSGRYPPYGGGFGGGYGASGLGGYGRGGEGYGNYGASGYTSAYESGPGTSYGGAGGLYGRGGYTGTSRYHPYAR